MNKRTRLHRGIYQGTGVGRGNLRKLGLWVMRFPGLETRAASQMKRQDPDEGTEEGGRRV